MLGTILIVILIVLIFGSAPRWGHSQTWGWGPSGGMLVLLLVLVVLIATGRV